MKDPGNEKKPSNKPPKKHRVLVKPEELGLTARIKKALVQPEMGLTQRIKRAVASTQDKESKFFISPVIAVVLVLLLLAAVALGYFAFQSREYTIVVEYPNKKEEPLELPVSMSFFESTKTVKATEPRRQVNYIRTDIYGDELADDEFYVTQQNKKVESKYNLPAGDYTIHITKKGFKKEELPMTIQAGKVTIPVELEPVREQQSNLVVHLNDPLLPGKKIEPDDVIIVNSGKSIINTQVKSGTYVVKLIKRGYHPKEVKLFVPESGKVTERFTLEHKKRTVEFLVKDGLSRQGAEPRLEPDDFRLLQEGVEIPLANNLLLPGKYNLLVEKNGYERTREQIKVLPGETVFVHYVEMNPLKREVVVKHNYDITPPDLEFDNAYLVERFSENKNPIPIQDSLMVEPAYYWLFVEKAGYRPYKKDVFISPGSTPLALQVDLVSASKTILLTIRSDYDIDPLVVPDELKIKMLINKIGYRGIGWDDLMTDLPKEKKEVGLSAFLETIPRVVSIDLTSSLNSLPLQADLVTLAKVEGGKEKGKRETVDGQKKFKPAIYKLTIAKTGYVTIEENVIIPPGDGAYVIKKKLEPYRRELILKLDSDYNPGAAVVPDEILLDGEKISAGHRLDPGTYRLTLKKAGYKPITDEKIEVVAANEPFVYKSRLQAKDRKVVFDIVGGAGFGELSPDKVSFDNNPIQDGDFIPPKKNYAIKVEKLGFVSENLTATVEPSEDPFTLKVVLNPKIVPVDIKLTATFPAGKNLLPADECTLGAEPFREGLEVKPGTYKLYIKKGGYIPIEEEIEVPPSEGVFRIVKEMKPRDRVLKMDIQYDVAPENRDMLNTVAKIKRAGDNFETILRNGMDVAPNNYRLEIMANGYEKISEDIEISPSDSPYILSKVLKATPRTVVFRCTSDWPVDKKLEGFKVSLSGQSVDNVSNLKPGKYSLVIEKAGYHNLNQDISIPAGMGEYVVEKRLSSKPRVVNYQLTDAESGEEITPDVVTLGPVSVMRGDTTFKPGNYELQIKAQGYDVLQETIEIPVGEEPYTIKRVMEPSYRLVKYELKGDFNNADLTPTEITLNGNPVEYGKTTVRPDSYDLVVYVPGYVRVQDRLDIPASKDPFIIRRNLVSKKRPVAFDIKADFPPDVALTPDRVLFGNQEMTEGSEIKPKASGYQITIEKAGYEPLTKQKIIKPSEKAWILEAQMQARPRRLVLEIDSDYRPGVSIPVDRVEVDGKTLQASDRITPGVHTFVIEKAGYETLTFEETVEAADSDFVLKRQMIAKPRLVQAKIIGDVVGQEIEPEVLTLGEKDISEGEMFKPGAYELNISHLGYGEIREKIEIEPSPDPKVIERTLRAIPRKVVTKIDYDVKPPGNLSPLTVRVRNLKSNSFVRISSGDELKPGEYQLRIEKEGYETHTSKMILFPDVRPYTIEVKMIAKFVRILIEMSHDVKPPENVPSYTVTFVDPSGIGRLVTNGKRIKPGEYSLEIAQPGYQFEDNKKKIYVPPGSKDFYIREKLHAKERSLSFDMIYDGEVIKAHQVLIDNRVVTPKDTFKPGREYNLIAKFLEYGTVDKKVTIEPGEGPFVVNVDLVRLKKYELKIADKYHNLVLYQLKYPLEVYADGEALAPHHIIPGEGFSLIYYTIFAPEELRRLRVYAAFYTDESRVRDSFEFRELKEIDAGRLMEHLRELAKGRSPIQAVKQMVDLLRDEQDAKKVMLIDYQKREKIANMLRDLPLDGAMEQDLRNQVVRKLLNQ